MSIKIGDKFVSRTNSSVTGIVTGYKHPEVTYILRAPHRPEITLSRGVVSFSKLYKPERNVNVYDDSKDTSSEVEKEVKKEFGDKVPPCPDWDKVKEQVRKNLTNGKFYIYQCNDKSCLAQCDDWIYMKEHLKIMHNRNVLDKHKNNFLIKNPLRK